ncbi:MAG: hypothetical protein JKY55_17305 [Aliivibrio sp.]|uniref:hypothetical protein n=1 Tax=Aliivibrio sp. TaxID=1872443 RepID=UPI001A62D872|nr:hypothetical protein [Aliivibrio sp.]
MTDKDKKNTVTELSTEQQKAIIDTKEVLASKQDVLMAIGQVQAFNNIRKYSTVGELLIFKKIKESKQYKGLVYIDENGESSTVGDIKDVCKYLFNRSYSAMFEELQNLDALGQDFIETSQRIGLGNRELRKLRQLPSEEQALIINNEAVDLGDKEAVKELIEDYTFSHLTEKSALKKQLDEANKTVEAVRENSAQKQQELDEVKEREAKRKFSQAPWQRQTLDRVEGMLDARLLITQGLNQLEDIHNDLIADNENLEQKTIDYIARCLLTELKYNKKITSDLFGDVFAILGATYMPDISAEEVYEQLPTFNELLEKK